MSLPKFALVYISIGLVIVLFAVALVVTAHRKTETDNETYKERVWRVYRSYGVPLSSIEYDWKNAYANRKPELTAEELEEGAKAARDNCIGMLNCELEPPSNKTVPIAIAITLIVGGLVAVIYGNARE